MKKGKIAKAEGKRSFRLSLLALSLGQDKGTRSKKGSREGGGRKKKQRKQEKERKKSERKKNFWQENFHKKELIFSHLSTKISPPF
ncbi:unnamed protein product [Coffea canephora]|uniref:Uncharacterized protein n=1 Tax=Coffea canephora TaxID=49390 RepID=A0A068UJK2_COFCA|nr:unnamed protein product [Coffea canephora]